MTLGQEFSGYAQQLTMARLRVEMAFAGLMELAIGGTAVGTGLNTHPDFAGKVCNHLKQKTALPFVEAQNHFEAQGARDACVFLSGTLKSLAIALMKIANDLRLLASGPRAGLSEITIPELQAGSSIMPGKFNPVVCESVMQIAAQVQGNDLVISLAGQHGNLELNAMLPVLADNLLESIAILASGMTLFAEKCVDLIIANRERCAELTEKSLSLVTNLVPILGYDKATAIAKKAYRENRKLRDVLEEEKILSSDELDKLLDPKKMLSPD
jgi:fumarate hydratase class II